MQAETSLSSERLPVNPRRRKVAPENRRRVARACNGCNVRRIKCSGEQPCQQCRSASRECLYPSPEASKEATLRSEVERLRKRCATLEKGLQTVVTDDTARQELLRQVEDGDSPQQVPGAALAALHLDPTYTDEAEPTEGRLLFDPDGNVRFLGETSGATFLDLLKHFMLTLVPLAFVPGPAAAEDGSTFVASIGQYQTFDSRPLLDPDVDPLWLPSRTEMTLMLAELCYHIQDGNGDFLSGGIYYWGDLSNVPSPVILSSPPIDIVDSDAYRYMAFNHVSFALASQVVNQIPRQGDDHAGDAFFKRARMLLGNPLDTTRFTLRDVPVLAMMGFYLIERNRRDYAYMYVGLAIHLAITHGAFRHCVDEASKRIFWTLYILDRWLSCLMGRPSTLIDEAIRLPLPADDPSMPSAAGLIAHVQLARISSYIVCETFKIAPREPKSDHLAHDIDKAMGMLQGWLSQLPPSLQMPLSGFSVDPACCTLHMAYNQLILLTTRPVFFVAVKKAVAERYVQSGKWRLEQHPQYKHIQSCSAAAHFNITLAQWVVQLYNSRRLLQAGLHFVFNAAVILLLNRLLRAYSGSVDADIQFAIDIFAQESIMGNYQRDCYQVLNDLRTLIDRFLSPAKPEQFPQAYANQTSLPSLDAFSGGEAEPESSEGRQYYLNQGDDLYQELMTWTQIDDSQLHSTFRI